MLLGQLIVLIDILFADVSNTLDGAEAFLPRLALYNAIWVHFPPTVGREKQRAGQTHHHCTQRSQCPRFLGPDQPFSQEFLRKEIGCQTSFAQALQAEAVSDVKGQNVFAEGFLVHNHITFESWKLVKFDDFRFQVLDQVLSQTRQFGGIPDHDHAANFGVTIDTTEVGNRTLNFGDQIIKDWSHCLKKRFGIFGLACIPFQMLRLGERQLELTR